MKQGWFLFAIRIINWIAVLIIAASIGGLLYLIIPSIITAIKTKSGFDTKTLPYCIIPVGSFIIAAAGNEGLTRILNDHGRKALFQSDSSFQKNIEMSRIAPKQPAPVKPKRENKPNKTPADQTETARRFHAEKLNLDPDRQLDKLIGLTEVKNEVQAFRDLLAYEDRYGSPVLDNYHMLFLGGPGTGKTTVAKIIAAVMYKAKRVTKNIYLEVNAHDLMGRYLGETALIVDNAFKAAAGGVLFIDEAYAFSETVGSTNGASFGDEAITKMLSLLENNPQRTAVIFAGYPDKMAEFLQINPGLSSRIHSKLTFPDYTPDDICKILVQKLEDFGHGISADLLDDIRSIIAEKKALCEQEGKPFGNARYARNVASRLHQTHATNYAAGIIAGTEICDTDIVEQELLDID